MLLNSCILFIQQREGTQSPDGIISCALGDGLTVRLYLTQAATAPPFARSLSCIANGGRLQFPARCAAVPPLLHPHDVNSGRCGGTARRMRDDTMPKHRPRRPVEGLATNSSSR